MTAYQARCVRCGQTLTADEIAVTKKLVNRGARTFFCVDCLAERFSVTPAEIRERIDYFRSVGCTLFEPAAGQSGERSIP